MEQAAARHLCTAVVDVASGWVIENGCAGREQLITVGQVAGLDQALGAGWRAGAGGGVAGVGVLNGTEELRAARVAAVAGGAGGRI